MDKRGYDSYRQTVWNSFAALVGECESYRQSATLTRDILQYYIDSVSSLMQDFQITTASIINSGLDGSWVTPRYHDYYDFMTNVVNTWRNEIATLPSNYIAEVVDSVSGDTSTESPPSEEYIHPVEQYIELPNTSSGDNQQPMGLDIPIYIEPIPVQEEGEDVQALNINAGDIGDAINRGIDDIINAGIQQAGQATTMAATKSNYDRYREGVWNNFQSLIGQLNQYRDAGQLDRAGLQMYIDAATKIRDNFKKGTDAFLQQGLDPSWANPRFHDFYDFMGQIIQSLRTELSTMPSDVLGGLLGGIGDILGIGGGGGSNTPPPYSNTGNGIPVTTQQPIIAGTSNLLTIAIIGTAAYFLLRRR